MSDAQKYQTQKLTHLLDADIPPNPCWINPILPKGGTLLFGGHAKSGKSHVMMELCRALSTGKVPFDCPWMSVPRPVKVLFVEQELGEYGLQLRAKVLFANEDRSVFGDRLYYASKIPELQLDSREGRDLLIDLIEQVQPEVLFLDPIGRLHAYDENKSDQIQQLFNHLEELIHIYKDNDMSLVISHHFGKLPGDPKTSRDPMDPYNFRGSSKFFDDPDTLITMARLKTLDTKHKAWQIKMHFETRQDEGLPDMMMEFNREADLRVRYCELLGEKIQPMKKEADPDKVMPKKQLTFAKG